MRKKGNILVWPRKRQKKKNKKKMKNKMMNKVKRYKVK